MSDIYDWRDLEATAVAEPGGADVHWTVYEQVGWTSDEPGATAFYTQADQPRADELVEDIADAEVWIETSIKWDGCSELVFPNGMHVCGWPDAQNLHAVHSRLFEMTAWYLHGKCADSDGQLPAPRYTPSQVRLDRV